MTPDQQYSSDVAEEILGIEARVTLTLKEQMELNRKMERMENKINKRLDEMDKRINHLAQTVENRMARMEYLLVTMNLPKNGFRDIDNL